MPNGNEELYNRAWCDERYHSLQGDLGRVASESLRRDAELEKAVRGLSSDITQAARSQGRLLGIGLGLFSVLNLGVVVGGLLLGGGL